MTHGLSGQPQDNQGLWATVGHGVGGSHTRVKQLPRTTYPAADRVCGRQVHAQAPVTVTVLVARGYPLFVLRGQRKKPLRVEQGEGGRACQAQK